MALLGVGRCRKKTRRSRGKVACVLVHVILCQDRSGAVSSEWHSPQHHDFYQTGPPVSHDYPNMQHSHDYQMDHHQDHHHQQQQSILNQGHHDPQQHHHPQEPQQPQPVGPVPEESPARPPDMKLKHVIAALRQTTYFNDRLIRNSLIHHRNNNVMAETATIQPHNIPHVETPLTPPQTVFHSAKQGDSAAASSKSLRDMMTTILQATQLSRDERSVVLSLAMIYLDRATSVETPRSNGIPPCPFCTTSTVHRIVLTAILTALRVVQGQTLQAQLEPPVDESILKKCLPDLKDDMASVKDMMAWMEAALGDTRYYVSLEDMQHFRKGWERIFPPPTAAASAEGSTQDKDDDPDEEEDKESDNEEDQAKVVVEDTGEQEDAEQSK